jgi:hypothetical protein
MKRGFLETACVAFVVLFALAPGGSAQAHAKKKNLTRADREAWYKILRWPAELEDDWREAHENSGYGGLNFYDLGRGRYLVEVDAYPVAHQSGFVYLLYDERNEPNGPGRLLLLKGFEGKDESGHPLAVLEGVGRVHEVPREDEGAGNLLEVSRKRRLRPLREVQVRRPAPRRR